MLTNLTASQRLAAMDEARKVALQLGVPQAVYVAEHGVTILADPILAAKWATYGNLRITAGVVRTFVTQVKPMAVTA